jgi:replicative DNA helicase
MPAEQTNGHGRRAPATVADGPPCDPAAEAAVLSAILLRASVLDDVRDLLEPADFWLGPHRFIYEAIIAIDGAQRQIDPVTVRAQLDAMGLLKQVGGAAFVAQIVDATPSVANVAEHARIVRELGVLRRMGTTLHELAVTARSLETRADVASFLQRCEREVFAGGQSSEADTGRTMRQMMAAAVQHFDGTRPQLGRGLSTGFEELDRLSFGFRPGELWYLAARSGQGKTSLALNMAEAVARTGNHVVIFSMEMKWHELWPRFVSAMSGVHGEHVIDGNVNNDALSRIMAAIADLSNYPIKCDDEGALTPGRLRSRLRRHAAELRAEHPHARLGLVVVDYIQLMGADGKHRTRNDELEQISRSLKLLAGDFKCAVLVLSQLNRPDRRAASARPQLADIRGSGAMEQDGDKVLFIHRDSRDAHEAELILAKSRNGAVGDVTVGWEPWCTRFTERSQAGFAWQDPRYEPPDSRYEP